MKQLLQNYNTGELKVEDVPTPTLLPGGALVKTLYSAVSVGTERAMLSFAKQSMLGKARKRPDLVRQVIAKARTDGVLSAYRAARERLDRPMPLGYSS
ncbi:MAG: oxidoreductase, partial [Dehalococcoidia bacterium]|nr:oxidoreductase [Dehalococcoidia bacterium]